jgi:ferredoxin
MTYAIHITNTGEHFQCAATQNLLAGMEARARTGIPVGCRGGGCGVCKVHVESGQVRTEKMSRARLSAEEARQGFVLACRSYPTSDLTIRAVDRLARCIEGGR